MSLWIRRRDSDGNVHHYLIDFDPLAIIALLAVTIGLSLPLIFAYRDMVLGAPIRVAAAIVSALVIGLCLLTAAKWSVIRTGVLASFGPRPMSRKMRRLYFGGYAVIGCATILAALYVLVA